MMERSQPARPCFDSALGAWVLRRYAHVLAALNEPRLSAGGAAGADDAHIAWRQSAARALSSEHIDAWQRDMSELARQHVTQLPMGQPVELVHQFARPWSLSLALSVTSAPGEQREHLAALARQVFLAAVHATNGDVSDQAKTAAAEIARVLSGGSPEPSIAVQAFVALSQTLPCFLASAWLALLQHDDQLVRLRAEPGLLPRAVDELLRYAGPSRAVFRQARSDLSIGDLDIAQGDRVILMLAAANRDLDHFAHPDRLDIRRDTAGLMSFGRGAHYCVGAALIRNAVAVATRALIELPVNVALIGEVEWIDGFAIRGPTSLPVVLRERNAAAEVSDYERAARP